MKQASNSQEYEISLIDLIKIIWSKKLPIAKVTIFFVLFGFLIALTSNVEYSTSCKLLIETEEGNQPSLGGLGGLSGITGINLSGIGGSNTGLSPSLYPEIVSSTPFLESLIKKPLYFEKIDTTVNSYSYFKSIESPSFWGLLKAYTIGLPSRLLGSSIVAEDFDENGGNNIKRFSKGDWDILNDLSNRISIEVETQTGIVSISAEFPDPMAAAQMADFTVDELKKYIINYKTEKAAADLELIKSQFAKAQNNYFSRQSEVIEFVDRNRNLTSSTKQAELRHLENEMNIAFEIYKNLSGQLEQAKIKIGELTPVFTIMEPVKVPFNKSKPKRKVIVLSFFFLGLIVSTTFVVTKNLMKI